jgi:LuxR family maltose regulon positive regulatory protein
MNADKEHRHGITIVLADDNRAYREHLRGRLNQEPDMTVVAQVADGQAAVKTIQDLARRSQAPDLIIMDVTMVPMNGMEATRQILSSHPSVKILALSIHDHRQFVEAMVQAGASGYALKDDTFTDLTRAIRAVAAGQTYFSPGLGLPGSGDGPPADPRVES